MSDNSSLIAKNVEDVRRRIQEAALRAGVPPDTIMLIAAAKTKGTGEVREAAAAGVGAIGENRVQEMLLKYDEGAYENIPLHFIGRLQRNKVSKVVGRASLIHSVDSRELMSVIDRCASAKGLVQDALIEINIADELSKSGIAASEVRTLLENAAGFSNIRIRGLMSIPPAHIEISETRRYFQKIYKLFVDISHEKRHNVSMEYLSMGMSGDFEAAVEEGANMVRVGSAIFGYR